MKAKGREAEGLAAICSGVVVVAHKEDTLPLRSVLARDGFRVEEVRGPYTEEQATYCAHIRCLVNHSNAWTIAAQRESPTIVVEADFVPVVGFGELIPPFSYRSEDPTPQFGWLYSAGSILYGIDPSGFPHGHGNTTVAYLLNAAAARILLKFFAREMTVPSPGTYRPWETYLGIFLRHEYGILNHIPVYQYGEHGGLANREHALSGVRSWHEADLLWGPLAFMPAYASGRSLRFRLHRLRGWLRGVARLVTLRFYDPRFINDDSRGGRATMAVFAIARMVKLASIPLWR